MTTSHYIDATMQWVDDVVITHNFCPFARFVRTPNQIRCVEVNGDTGDAVMRLYDECVKLDSNNDIATTLVILTHSHFTQFDNYLDALAIAERMMADWGYAGTYQLASFHPEYRFDGEPQHSASHYTNRSPYPMFHLIREDDITRYMPNEDDAEAIYTNNMKKAEELGCPYFNATLTQIKEKHKQGL
ncbi:DUF1415 domain-containing protein [Alteromonas sp. A079]|uniref:DUF1415 domain-containing protein n=1 Tax=Alteromonas sp. A079 TaxID=3410268 RepID=UPI003BA32586